MINFIDTFIIYFKNKKNKDESLMRGSTPRKCGLGISQQTAATKWT